MSKIVFFGIPAHGHTNPTLEVVKELIRRGHEIRYYSYDSFKRKIEKTGAEYISCDSYDIQMKLTPQDGERIGKDIVFSTEILVKTTLAMDDTIIDEVSQWKPDCIVADSMAIWGKLAAHKLSVPFISSTTTFAFNRHSAKIMKQDITQLFKMLFSIPRANKLIKKLRTKGYPVKNVLSVVQNDNDTDTIVYTSPEFQPCSDTFSDKYTFVGPSIRTLDYKVRKPQRRTVYISMGTVNNVMENFYKKCIVALKDSDLDVIMSVGEFVDLERFGDLPQNFTIARSVNQIEVLQQVDVFLTHCGMNSVSEALYYKVPLVLFPQTPEQGGVAYRVNELGAGVYLNEDSPDKIKETIQEVFDNYSYKQSAEEISKSFHRCGGYRLAADKIENLINEGQ
ncbi:MAG: macrolide family glycosyltransferase [Tissierella sp.]|jgi:MGT family glycosyltransferase|uniref:macrolide family glycosyltransferase n=1 Tax=Tissierella sp. TaxID=41274 RepID=UPI003F987802